MKSHYLRPLITQEQLQSRIHELSKTITRDYSGSSLIVIGVLKGAFMFLTDLVRGMDLPLAIDFVRTSSYSGTESTGIVRITHDLGSTLKGKHVLIVDDIADTRLTLLRLMEDIQLHQPASIRIACLLNKGARARFSVPIDYIGFEIPDEYVIGYGMDLDGAYRNLPYIAVYDAKAAESIVLSSEIRAEQNKILRELSNESISTHLTSPSNKDITAFGLLLHISRQTLKTLFGDFQVDVFQNLYTRSYVLVVSIGDLSKSEPLLIRVHSSCITSEAFGAYDCDCSEQLDLALQRIAEVGRGAIVYLLQEGRGAGYSSKARDRMLVQASQESKTTFEAYEQLGLNPDHRRYGEVTLALRILGVTAPIKLLTNNPDKVRELEHHGLKVVQLEPVIREANPFNAHYLRSKRHAGHTLTNIVTSGIALPEVVQTFPPTPMKSAPHLVQMASYLLPLRASFKHEHSWFWSHVYFDLLAGCERVVLTYRKYPLENNTLPPYVRIQRESLFERFPVEQGIYRRQWQATVDEIVRYGYGIAVFPTADGYDEEFAATLIPTNESREKHTSRRLTEKSIYQLLAHHAPEKFIVPIFTNLDTDQNHQKLIEEFDRHGFIRTNTAFLSISA